MLLRGFPDNLHLYARLVPRRNPPRRVVTSTSSAAITLVVLKITRDSGRVVTTTEPGEVVELRGR